MSAFTRSRAADPGEPDDTVESLNLILETNLTAEEKKDFLAINAYPVTTGQLGITDVALI